MDDAPKAPEPAEVTLVDLWVPAESWQVPCMIEAACWTLLLEWTRPSSDHGADYEASHGQLVLPEPMEDDAGSGLFA